MEKLRIVLLIVFSCSSFALDTHFESEEEIKFANELFTQKEKDWSNIWTFDFAQNVNHVDDFTNFNDTKISHVFNIPHFKFYKSADLTGEVFAQIDDKGLKVGNNYICHIERGSKWTFILTQKKDWDSSEAGKGSRGWLKDSKGKFIKQVSFCRDFFLYVKPGSGQHFTLQTTFPVINHKIGKVKMRGVDVYFDATAWISTYSAKTDALTTLKKVLTQDDFDQIYELMKKLRKLIEAGDKEGIFTLLTGEKIDDINKVGAHGVLNIKSYFNVSKEELLNFKFDETKKNNLLKITTFMYKIAGGDKSSKNSIRISTYGINTGHLYLEKYNGSWTIEKFSLIKK